MLHHGGHAWRLIPSVCISSLVTTCNEDLGNSSVDGGRGFSFSGGADNWLHWCRSQNPSSFDWQGYLLVGVHLNAYLYRISSYLICTGAGIFAYGCDLAIQLFLVDRVSECQRHYFPKVLGVVRAAFEEAGHLGYFAHHLKNLRAGRLRKKPALMRLDIEHVVFLICMGGCLSHPICFISSY